MTAALMKADFRLISPHSAYDWSTLAARICIRLGMAYNMEADWNLPEVRRDALRKMPFGFNRMRRALAGWMHDKHYFKSLGSSSLSLLQGGDVFHDLAPLAPNAFRVLNVQVTAADHIGRDSLARKLENILSNDPLRIIYAGRAEGIKGPLEWLDVITLLRDWSCNFSATWLGTGEMLPMMRKIVVERGLSQVCSLPGKVDRPTAREQIETAHIFMFCHLAKESPRCLVEALALGTPIIGFGTNYPRALVEQHGGGMFVDRGETTDLATIVLDLTRNRRELADLTNAAAESGRALDMQSAIQERIDLIRRHLPRS